ncbi:hypothetical protein [uncultured Sphingomonas sp.]|uniref:hypothetical protein n=1 Tax=uncultured Sphingomonas sp. TaxID=158754 RepID=UPI0035CB110D
MNQVTSAPGASLLPDTIDLFTDAHLAIIAIFALLVIAAMIWGARLKRGRKAALRDVAEHNQVVEQETRRDATPAAPTRAARTQEAPGTPDRALPRSPAGPTFAPPPPAGGPAPGAPLAPDRAAADGSVTQLKGLGPKLADRLAELGVTTVGQIAALNDDEAAALDAQLGAFTGRMTRDRWQEQARFLAAGDRAGFEAVFGRL